ncbi:acyltransferase family protein [Phocaeicola plebeius]
MGFFALGCYLGRTKISPSIRLAILTIVVGLILSILESFFWLDYNPNNNWLGLKSSVHILSFGIILLLLSKKLSINYTSNKFKSLIEWFGRQSMPIYTSHMIIMFSSARLGFSPNNWAENWIVIFILDIIVIYIISKILPKKILPYLGIR